MSETPDAALVAETLSGGTESFCTLVRRYQDYVYGLALGILSDFDLALDAAQEAFLCAYCDLSRLKDPARFGGWLRGIARNTAFEIMRDRQRQQALAVRSAGRDQDTGLAESADERAAEAEQRRQVQDALAHVGDKDREALTLYYCDGLSYAQVCDFLEISKGTLKGRLQRGRAALRKELAMVERTCKESAPDEAFAHSLEQALRVFSAKGPPTNHIPSEWHTAMRDETRRVLNAGDEGFRIALALSHAGSGRLRGRAAVLFGLMNDERSLRELERMLGDRAARVRPVLWYAKRIHPQRPKHGAFAPAGEIAPGIEHLLPFMTDDSFNVRLRAVMAVGAYLPSGDERVVQGLRTALDDPKHKVRHAAARLLRVPCPGCGRTW